MGVRGLFSFFQNNHDDFFVQHDLHNSILVVDGNNLRYHLYNTCPRKNCCFGGDYDKYYNHVLLFFQNLISCQIKPIVVIDGSFDEAKKKTLWQINIKQWLLSHAMPRGTNCYGLIIRSSHQMCFAYTN